MPENKEKPYWRNYYKDKCKYSPGRIMIPRIKTMIGLMRTFIPMIDCDHKSIVKIVTL